MNMPANAYREAHHRALEAGHRLVAPDLGKAEQQVSEPGNDQHGECRCDAQQEVLHASRVPATAPARQIGTSASCPGRVRSPSRAP